MGRQNQENYTRRSIRYHSIRNWAFHSLVPSNLLCRWKRVRQCCHILGFYPNIRIYGLQICLIRVRDHYRPFTRGEHDEAQLGRNSCLQFALQAPCPFCFMHLLVVELLRLGGLITPADSLTTSFTRET